MRQWSSAEELPVEALTLPLSRDDELDPVTEGWQSEERAIHRDTPVPAAPALQCVEDPAARYETESVLGKGGMGEVRLCTDRRIGREVAMKVVLPTQATRQLAHSRFVQEALLQARLEHPAIVPVYDLGIGPDGAAYFTMKRVRGRTLAELIHALVVREPGIEASVGPRRLLTAFGQVCLAVDYAHARGVVHRDLKPHNVMLGDFGEVYVLDWGLAKVQRDEPPEPRDASSRPRTARGQVLGTPGYMAPEQLAGRRIDARTDVYALGAILWEIIAIDRHSGDETAEPPPELTQIVERALSSDPADRHPTARALWEEVERVVDGDQDLALRRARADAHAAAGQAHAARALVGEDEGAHDERRRALRELGQALAFDPTHAEARRALVHMLLQPPETMPAEVERDLDVARADADRAAGIWGSLALLYCLGAAPIAWWMGARDVPLTIFWVAVMGSAAGLRLVTAFRPSLVLRAMVLVLSTAAFVGLARVLGPLLVLPGILAANTSSYMLARRSWLRVAAVCLALASVLGPWVLEQWGVLAPSYAWVDGQLLIRSHTTSLPEIPTTLLLLLCSVGVVLLPSLYVGRTARALAEAEGRLALHAWQMRQVVAEDPADRPQV